MHFLLKLIEYHIYKYLVYYNKHCAVLSVWSLSCMYFHSEMGSNPSQMMMIARLYFCIKHLCVCFVMSSSSRHDLSSQSTIQQHLVNQYFIQCSAVQMLSPARSVCLSSTWTRWSKSACVILIMFDVCSNSFIWYCFAVMQCFILIAVALFKHRAKECWMFLNISWCHLTLYVLSCTLLK